MPVPLNINPEFKKVTGRFSVNPYTVNLSEIDPYSEKLISNQCKIGFSDFQIAYEGTFNGRFGSGRSVFFDGHYFKGVGRTQLAGNWNNQKDIYHSSGHLFASSGIREWMATQYCIQNHCSEHIVACKALFLKPVSNHLIKRFNSLPSGSLREYGLHKIDTNLQAITVKNGDFFRFSNLTWMLKNIGIPHGNFSITNFLALLRTGLLGNRASDCQTPEQLIEALEQTIEKGLRRFSDFHRIGIGWGSYYNNFTIDLRFLDLEVPRIIGGPLIGYESGDDLSKVIQTKELKARSIPGFEFLEVGKEVGAFIRFMKTELSNILTKKVIENPRESTFLKLFLKSLNKAFPEKHFIFREQDLFEKIIRTHSVVSKIDYQPLFREIGLSTRIKNGTIQSLRNKTLELKRIDHTFPRVEPFHDCFIYQFRGFEQMNAKHLDRAREFNQAIQLLDSTDSLSLVKKRIKDFNS